MMLSDIFQSSFTTMIPSRLVGAEYIEFPGHHMCRCNGCTNSSGLYRNEGAHLEIDGVGPFSDLIGCEMNVPEIPFFGSRIGGIPISGIVSWYLVCGLSEWMEKCNIQSIIGERIVGEIVFLRHRSLYGQCHLVPLAQFTLDLYRWW